MRIAVFSSFYGDGVWLYLNINEKGKFHTHLSRVAKRVDGRVIAKRPEVFKAYLFDNMNDLCEAINFFNWEE